MPLPSEREKVARSLGLLGHFWSCTRFTETCCGDRGFSLRRMPDVFLCAIVPGPETQTAPRVAASGKDIGNSQPRGQCARTRLISAKEMNWHELQLSCLADAASRRRTLFELVKPLPRPRPYYIYIYILCIYIYNIYTYIYIQIFYIYIYAYLCITKRII